MLFMTLSVWIGMVAYFSSIIISIVLDPSAGRGGPHVYQGWPNRFMVATYAAWIVTVGQRFSQANRTQNSTPSPATRWVTPYRPSDCPQPFHVESRYTAAGSMHS